MHLLFTQVHLLFDSSTEGQYVTHEGDVEIWPVCNFETSTRLFRKNNKQTKNQNKNKQMTKTYSNFDGECKYYIFLYIKLKLTTIFVGRLFCTSTEI